MNNQNRLLILKEQIKVSMENTSFNKLAFLGDFDFHSISLDGFGLAVF